MRVGPRGSTFRQPRRIASVFDEAQVLGSHQGPTHVARRGSKGPDFFVCPTSAPGTIEAGRERVPHLQPSTAESGLHVCFREAKDLCSFVDTEVLDIPQYQHSAVFLWKR